jgi:protein-S-isoprenylcysteine O-methyltransferase Ste14
MASDGVALLVAAIVLLAAAAQQTAAGVSWVTVEAEGNSTVLYAGFFLSAESRRYFRNFLSILMVR